MGNRKELYRWCRCIAVPRERLHAISCPVPAPTWGRPQTFQAALEIHNSPCHQEDVGKAQAVIASCLFWKCQFCDGSAAKPSKCKVEHLQWKRQFDHQWSAPYKPLLMCAGSWSSRRTARMTLWFKSWSWSIQSCVMLKYTAGLLAWIVYSSSTVSEKTRVLDNSMFHMFSNKA